MTSLLLASFVAGFLTVLAPCLLPLLPVVIGGSFASDSSEKRNPYIIILALLISVIVFTLIIQGISQFFFVPDTFWRNFSATLVLIVGLYFLFPNIWYKLPFIRNFSVVTGRSLGSSQQKKGLFGDIAIGVSLGPVFSSCSPTYLLILATILPRGFFEGLIYLIAYVVGLGVVLLFIALVGQIFVEKLTRLATRKWFKYIIGIIMVVVAIMIYTGLDKDLAEFLLDAGFIDFTQFELNI